MQMVILSGIVLVLSIFLYVQLEHQTQINLCPNMHFKRSQQIAYQPFS